LAERIPESELAERCRQGDKAAEKELYMTYADRLRGLCSRYCSCPEDARDLLHDAMVKALGAIGKFRYSGPGSLFAWLKRITINLATDRYRSAKLPVVPLDDIILGRTSSQDTPELDTIPDQVLIDLVSRLPERRRMVLNLYCIDGYSHREIGRMLGITERGSASIYAQARSQMQQMIIEYKKNHG